MWYVNTAKLWKLWATTEVWETMHKQPLSQSEEWGRSVTFWKKQISHILDYRSLEGKFSLHLCQYINMCSVTESYLNLEIIKTLCVCLWSEHSAYSDSSYWRKIKRQYAVTDFSWRPPVVGELRRAAQWSQGLWACWMGEGLGEGGTQSRIYWNGEWDQSRNLGFDNPSDAVGSHRRSPCSWCNEDDYK